MSALAATLKLRSGRFATSDAMVPTKLLSGSQLRRSDRGGERLKRGGGRVGSGRAAHAQIYDGPGQAEWVAIATNRAIAGGSTVLAAHAPRRTTCAIVKCDPCLALRHGQCG